MARKSPPRPASIPLELSVIPAQADSLLAECIASGRALRSDDIHSWVELESTRDDFFRWCAQAEQLLKSLFTNDTVAESFCHTETPPERSPSLAVNLEYHRKDIDSRLLRLEAIKTGLDQYPLIMKRIAHAPPRKRNWSSDKRVLIAHGQDNESRDMLLRFFTSVGLQTVLLPERLIGTRTFTNLLKESSAIDFAILLLTPEGSAAGTNARIEGQSRLKSAQDLILGLGMLIGKLESDRLGVLYTAGVMLPAQITGIPYILLDEMGEWRRSLARKLRAAGIDADIRSLGSRSRGLQSKR